MTKIKENNLLSLKKEMANVKKEHGDVNSLYCWAFAIRLKRYSEAVMKEAFEKYVDCEDYHPSERKQLLNFKKLAYLNP